LPTLAYSSSSAEAVFDRVPQMRVPTSPVSEEKRVGAGAGAHSAIPCGLQNWNRLEIHIGSGAGLSDRSSIPQTRPATLLLTGGKLVLRLGEWERGKSRQRFPSTTTRAPIIHLFVAGFCVVPHEQVSGLYLRMEKTGDQRAVSDNTRSALRGFSTFSTGTCHGCFDASNRHGGGRAQARALPPHRVR
jgi:hypothetical protein